MELHLNPKKTFKVLLLCLVFLLIANLAAIGFRYLPSHPVFNALTSVTQLFDFNSERSFPTLYSFLLLLGASWLLFIISVFVKRQKKGHHYWLVLSFIFLFLAIDEALMIHEKIMVYTRMFLNTSGYLYYAWIIPYGILLIIFCVSYLPFLWRLPQTTRQQFILAGTIFVIGAIGIESMGGKQFTLEGEENLTFKILYTIEELFEILGITIFIYALLGYLRPKAEHLTIILKRKEIES